MAKRLLPKIDHDLCIGCALCVAACPYEVLEMQGALAVVVKPEACVVLRACEEACPTAAITIEEQEISD